MLLEYIRNILDRNQPKRIQNNKLRLHQFAQFKFFERSAGTVSSTSRRCIDLIVVGHGRCNENYANHYSTFAYANTSMECFSLGAIAWGRRGRIIHSNTVPCRSVVEFIAPGSCHNAVHVRFRSASDLSRIVHRFIGLGSCTYVYSMKHAAAARSLSARIPALTQLYVVDTIKTAVGYSVAIGHAAAVSWTTSDCLIAIEDGARLVYTITDWGGWRG